VGKHKVKRTQKYKRRHKFITEEKYTKRKEFQCDFPRFGGEIAWDWREKKERREASRGITILVHCYSSLLVPIVIFFMDELV